MNKEKIKEYIAGGAFVWIIIWAMAADSPDDAGLIAAGLTMLGVLVLAIVLLIEWRKENDKRL